MQEGRQTVDFSARLAGARPLLLRMARQQLRNEAWAEDVASETLLAALEGRASFDGRSQLSTWLVAILRHKAVDHLRRHGREVVLADAQDSTVEEQLEALFVDARGGHGVPQRPWPDPEDAMAQRQFVSEVEACVERLPDALGRVFLMRDWLELDTDEICRELGVTRSNVWVMLHRARRRLRECMQSGCSSCRNGERRGLALSALVRTDSDAAPSAP